MEVSATATIDTPANRPSPGLRIVQRRPWGSWILGALAVTVILTIVYAGWRANIIDVKVFSEYLFAPLIMRGAWNTLVLGTLALFVACNLGFIIALMRLSGNPVLVAVAAGYVYVFRGTPMLIQIIFWFNAVPIMFPQLSITLPFLVDPLVDVPITTVVTPFVAALAGMSLAEAAFMSEIIRGGIMAVDQGQRMAARALGMTQTKVLQQVIVPQAGRIIIPSTGNEYINLIKSTSLASVIGYLELLRITTDIYSSNFRVVELLAVAAIWYLAMTAFASTIQTTLEKLFPQR
jgi:polar amino acid transport system permease protein